MYNTARSGVLPLFSPAATQAAVEASTESFPADYITNIILEISGYLVSLVEQTALFGRPSNDHYSPSLGTLHARLHGGQLNPSPIQSHANETARIKATLGQHTTTDVTQRPLEDFEDLYYAVLARMQDIHQILNARLGSGFSTFTDAVYPDGPSIADLYVSLAQYWDALNHNKFVKAIDCAVRRSRVKYLHQEIIAQVHNDEITHSDAEELLNDLYDPKDYNGIQGLAWVSGWAPSMVAAWLQEKYRIVLKIEKEDADSKSRMERRRARMGRKFKQPQHELRSKKEVKKVVEGMDMAGGEVKKVVPVAEQQEEQAISGHQDPQDQLLQYALEWQIKTQRVSEYSQYLRSMASRNARYLVESTTSSNDMRMGNSNGAVQYDDNEDTNMAGRVFWMR
ncbi:uncharacterized protein M421DRAFT_235 [Didymella exigua CBS 183.55]|uniref:Uncharacterized protein n=1 Tax=Didymella exigua CBS 183.55 TaxID=1150837 RepID=A0A6A5S3R2_9PLEO|nr:uncharacterized protein M421DRAFT_235 [Didymella exigua CBS 183.55]KAF1934074.1 hypothetical protein M421DRAFT_235 [Didymella exigua CBS 183.55]